MGKITPGALYVGSGRRYVDSQALRNIAHTHDVVEMQGGWRILGADGVVAAEALAVGWIEKHQIERITEPRGLGAKVSRVAAMNPGVPEQTKSFDVVANSAPCSGISLDEQSKRSTA